METVLAELLAQRQVPHFDAVRDRLRLPPPAAGPDPTEAVLDFGVYDDRLAGAVARG